MLYALLQTFLGLFRDLSNPRKQLLLQRDMITSSSVKHIPPSKTDIAWCNFAYLCKTPVSMNSAMDFRCVSSIDKSQCEPLIRPEEYPA